MPSVLHLLAHPGLASSRVNAAMWAAGSGIAGVTRADLYARLPRYDIDIAAEQARLLAHDVLVPQFPPFWYSRPAVEDIVSGQLAGLARALAAMGP